MQTTKRIRLAKKLHVVFSHDEHNQLHVDWQPAIPTRPNRQIWRRYKLARDTYLQELAESQGINLLVADAESLRTFQPEGASPAKGWNEQ